jgi:hypothetical protein
MFIYCIPRLIQQSVNGEFHTSFKPEVGKQTFLESANCKSANPYAHSAIANIDISQVCQSENPKSAILSINPRIRKFLRNTAQCCLHGHKRHKTKLVKVKWLLLVSFGKYVA